MKIFVEAGRLSTTHFTGISNVIAQALLAWADASPDDEFIVASYAPFNTGFATKAASRPNIILQINPVPRLIPAGARNAWWFYTRLPALVRRAEPTWYWASSSLVPFALPQKLSILTTIYDLVPILHRNTMSRKGRIITKLSFRYSIKRANALWTISNFVKEQLHTHVAESRTKPIAVACAIDHEQFKPQKLTESERQRFLKSIAPAYSSGKSLLFVGTTEPRKNLSFLVSLMPELSRHQINLFVVGARGWGTALTKRAVEVASRPENLVHFAGKISNDELSMLYASVDLFVSASHDEGFCMPAVEAMACQTPVLLAHNSAMKEIIGSGGMSVRSIDQNTWVNSIYEMTANNNLYAPQEQAKKYLWQTQICNVIEVVRAGQAC